MSRMATSEYIGAKRRAYAQADRARRTRILGEARLDSTALQDDLMKLCDDWLGFRNVLCPCKRLVSREGTGSAEWTSTGGFSSACARFGASRRRTPPRKA